jgi:PAS domain S-box-containing protein
MKGRHDDCAALLLATGDAIIAAAPDGSILLWNPAAGRVFGYSEKEAPGRTLDLIVPERFRARHWTR